MKQFLKFIFAFSLIAACGKDEKAPEQTALQSPIGTFNTAFGIQQQKVCGNLTSGQMLTYQYMPSNGSSVNCNGEAKLNGDQTYALCSNNQIITNYFNRLQSGITLSSCVYALNILPNANSESVVNIDVLAGQDIGTSAFKYCGSISFSGFGNCRIRIQTQQNASYCLISSDPLMSSILNDIEYSQGGQACVYSQFQPTQSFEGNTIYVQAIGN